MYVKITVNDQDARPGVISTESRAAWNVSDLGNGSSRVVRHPGGIIPERLPAHRTATRINGRRGIEIWCARAAHVVGRGGRVYCPILDVVADERVNVVWPRINVLGDWWIRPGSDGCCIAVLADGIVSGDSVLPIVADLSRTVTSVRQAIAIIEAVYHQIAHDGDRGFR